MGCECKYTSFEDGLSLADLCDDALDMLEQYKAHNLVFDHGSNIDPKTGRLSPIFNGYHEIVELAYMIDYADALILEIMKQFPVLQHCNPEKAALIEEFESETRKFLRNLAGGSSLNIREIKQMELIL